MNLLKHPVVTALGLTQIYLLTQMAQFIPPDHLYLYHWSGSTAGAFLPILLIFCLVWLMLSAILLLSRNLGRWEAAVWCMAIAPALVQLCRICSMIAGKNLPLWLDIVVSGVAAAVVIGFIVFWRPDSFRHFERVRRIASTMLGFVALVALISLSRVLWAGWNARGLNAALPLHQFHEPAVPKPRIIWILFDELSYQQLYGQRYPGLELPAFDQLAAQSTIFTNTTPAGAKTEKVIPSLLTGFQVDDIKSSTHGQLSLHSPISNAWERFDPHQTVFQDALDSGYSTAVAGWYNPYCRIMPQVLDHCFWTFNTLQVDNMSPSRTITGSVWAWLDHKAHFLSNIVERLQGHPLFDKEDARLHHLDYSLLYGAADRLLQDRSATFIFLHMPLPHPGGFYNRSTGQFATTHATYIDNLALADKYLAHVHALLQQEGTWDSSTIVIMGDHSWRTYMWKVQPTWTPEEQAASHGGQYDPRPAYIVKLPNQHQPARISFSYEALHTRALMNALIAGQIHSPADLSAWAAPWQESTGSKAPASAH